MVREREETGPAAAPRRRHGPAGGIPADGRPERHGGHDAARPGEAEVFDAYLEEPAGQRTRPRFLSEAGRVLVVFDPEGAPGAASKSPRPGRAAHVARDGRAPRGGDAAQVFGGATGSEREMNGEGCFTAWRPYGAPARVADSVRHRPARTAVCTTMQSFCAWSAEELGHCDDEREWFTRHPEDALSCRADSTAAPWRQATSQYATCAVQSRRQAEVSRRTWT